MPAFPTASRGVLWLLTTGVMACVGLTSPKPGDPCSGLSPGLCTDEVTALNCRDGGLVRSWCDAGCSGAGVCDHSFNAIGEPCFDPFEGALAEQSLPNTRQCRDLDSHATLDCATGCSNAAALVCSGGALREVPCRGPNGCLSNPRNPAGAVAYRCDRSLANEGDNCLLKDEGFGACSAADPTQIVRCRAGRWTTAQTCPTRCTIDAGVMRCEGV